MTTAEEIGLLEAQLKDVYQDLWKAPGNDFYEERKKLQRIIDRKEPIVLGGRFAEYAKGVDIQSPMLESDVATHVDILSLDTFRLDLVARETSTDAKKDIEDLRIWLAQSLDRQNPGNRIGKAINRAQIVRGVAVVEKRWAMPEEPGEQYYKDRDVPDGDEKAREKFFQEQRDHCFQSYYVDPLEMCWAPLDEPTLFFRQMEISYTEAKKLHRHKDLGGGRLHFTARNMQVHFLDTKPVDEDAIYEASPTQKFDVVERQERNEDGEWWCTKWVKATGAGWDKGEIFEKYLIPFGRSSFFIIPGGNEDPTSQIPHLRYRPKIYAEAVLVYERNYISTLVVSLARMQLEDRFLSDEGIMEGAGAAKPLLLRTTPTDNPDELAALPGKVEAFPFPVSEHLSLRLQQIEVELERERPNRLMIGQATGKSDEPTATGLLDQRQAASLPYESDLKLEDNGWEEMARAELAALECWEKDEEAPVDGKKKLKKSYYYTATGNEPVMGKSANPGSEVKIDIDKIHRNYEVICRTRNKTMAEKLQSDLAAYQDRAQGTLTEEQLLKRLDYDDPQLQLEELQREKYRRMAEEELAPVERSMVKMIASAEWGLPLADIPLPQSELTNGSNVRQGPNPNQPAGNQLPLAGQVGPAVTPAPVAGPGDLRGPVGPGGI
jgi:hypothetical protein